MHHVSSACCLPASFTSFLPPVSFPSTNTMGMVHGRMNVTNWASPHLVFIGRALSLAMTPAGVEDRWGTQ